MNFWAKNHVDDEWLGLGDWFTSFISLGRKLHAAKAGGLEIRKVLLSVPLSDMVSLAMAIGFSRAAYESNVSLAQRIELDELVPGQNIQMRAIWNEANGKVTPPANFVGALLDILPGRDSASAVKLTFEFTDGSIVPRSINPSSAMAGETSPKKAIRFFEVPIGVPHKAGDLALSTRRIRERKVTRPKMTQDQIEHWFQRFEGWEYQVNPTLAVFGPATDIREYGRMLFRDDELHGTLLNIDHDEILDVARLDNLSNDHHPHFVNVIDQVARFPEPGTSQRATLEMFPFVCLDGNGAIASLSQKGALREKCVIGVWETSKPNLQQIALDVFLETASSFKRIDNFGQHISWTPPLGVQCWGWT